MPNYRWKNSQTGEELELLVKISDRDIPPDESGNWSRVLEAPALMQSTYLDGQRVKSDQAFNNFKFATKLREELADTTSREEKARINSEISKLEKI